MRKCCWILSTIILIVGSLGNVAVFGDVNEAHEKISVNSCADTYTSRLHPETNYGVADSVIVSGVANDQKNAYVSFSINERLYENDKVVLKMTPREIDVNDGEKEGIITVNASTEHDWAQIKLNWNNAHLTGNKLFDISVSQGTSLEVDVTKYVKENINIRNKISFVLTTSENSGKTYKFDSIEKKDGLPISLEIQTDALSSAASAQVSSNGLLTIEKIKKKVINTAPVIPKLDDDLNIDDYTTTRYRPWMVQYHMTTIKQVANRYLGGDASQMQWSFDVSPTNPDLILMGIDTSSIWRSENGGVTWRPSNTGATMIGCSAVRFYPDDCNIVFATTWNGSDGRDNPLAGIYKSEDAGNTWRQVYPNLPTTRIHSRILIGFSDKDESGKRKIYVLNNNKKGIYCSEDMGETWRNIGLVGEIGVWITNLRNEIIVATHTSGIMVTRNDGITWESKNNGLEGTKVNSVVIDPTNEKHWLCTTGEWLYQSYDSGETWSKLIQNTTLRVPQIYDLYYSAPDKNNHSRLYVVTGNNQYNFRYSDDNGKTFHKAVIHHENAFMQDNWGYGPDLLFTHPADPDVVWMPFDGEIYKSTDRGVNFYPSSSGFCGLRATNFYFNPKNNNDFYIGLIDRGFVRSIDTGRGEQYPAVDFMASEDRFWIRYKNQRNVKSIAIDPRNPNRLLANIGSWGNNCIVRESLDGGLNWGDILPGTEESSSWALTFHPQKPDVIYDGFFVSYDDGKTWERVEYEIKAVSPLNGDIVYGATQRYVYRSRDQGRTWEQLTNDVIPAANRIVCDLFDEDKVYIGTFGDGLIAVDGQEKTTFGKANGLKPSIGGGMGYYMLAQDPHDPLHLVTAGNDNTEHTQAAGVFESFNGGETWRAVEGMAGTRDCWCVAFHPNLPRVYFGTSNGVWVYEYDKYYDMSQKIYLDVDDSYAKDDINKLYKEKYLYQYHDGYFRPKEGMKRSEFISMIKKALNLVRHTRTQPFDDIKEDNAYYVDIQAAYDAGLISNDQDRMFYPDRKITYEEAAVIISKVLQYKHIQYKIDISKINGTVANDVSEGAKYAVYRLYANNIIDEKISFNAKSFAKNEDIATMFCRLLDLIR